MILSNYTFPFILPEYFPYIPLTKKGNDFDQNGDINDIISLSIESKVNTGSGNDTVYGSSGNDVLDGGIGNDVIHGSKGNDTIISDIGDDTLFGDEGNDLFVIKSYSPKTIIDGGQGVDTVYFTESGGIDEINLTKTNGENNSPLGIENIIGSNGHEIIIGDDGANVIFGSLNPIQQSSDSIYGGGGNDIISSTVEIRNSFGQSQSGSILDGEKGNDTLILSNILPQYQEDDYIFASLEEQKAIYTITWIGPTEILIGSGIYNDDDYNYYTQDIIDKIYNFENIIGSIEGDVIHGDEKINTIKGMNGDDILFGKAGDDTLLGGGGSDIISGDQGNDTIDGGHGSDTAVYKDTIRPITADLLAGVIETKDFGKDTLVSIENLAGGNGNDKLLGNKYNNSLSGGRGNDFLDGREGNDTTDYSESISEIMADLNLNKIKGADIGKDTLINIENITGGQASDILKGNEEDNILIGGKGNDKIYGKGGNDVLGFDWGNDVINGGEGTDTLLFPSGKEAEADYPHLQFHGVNLTVDLSAHTADSVILYRNAHAAELQYIPYPDRYTEYNPTPIYPDRGQYSEKQHDEVYNIENVTGGIGNDTLLGDQNNNVLVGSGGDDYLEGREGRDILEGGPGSDYLTGGKGNDILNGGNSYYNSHIYIPEAGDTANYNDNTQPLLINLLKESAESTETGKDKLLYIENITSGSGNDVIIGNNEKNSLYGNLGDDKIFGEDGNDILSGGEGDDFLNGGSFDSNTRDTYDIDTASYSFSHKSVTVSLSKGIAEGEDAGNDKLLDIENVIGGSRDDLILGDNNINNLDGGNGDDTIYGGGGNDVILGGAGSDVLHGGKGKDLLYGFNDTFETIEEEDEYIFYSSLQRNDIYVFTDKKESMTTTNGNGIVKDVRDHIMDFGPEDKVSINKSIADSFDDLVISKEYMTFNESYAPVFIVSLREETPEGPHFGVVIHGLSRLAQYGVDQLTEDHFIFS